MKTNKIIEALENLQVGDIIQIEKREGYIDVKRTSGWRPAPRPSDVMCAKCGGSRVLPTGKVKYSNPEHVEYKCKDCNYSFYVLSGVHSNINVHGVDLSILNEEDWFYVETALSRWIFKGKDIFSGEGLNIFYNLNDSSLYVEKTKLTSYKDNIFLLRKATPEDLAPLFEKYPQYAPVKDGDIGIFYDNLQNMRNEVKNNNNLAIGCIEVISNNRYHKESWGSYMHFFKVHESETIAEIKERFLKETENTI